MRILFLCNKSPWPPREGGPLAMNMSVEGLISAGHEVKVLAVNSYKYHIDPVSIPADYRHRTGIELIDIDLKIKPLHAFLNLFTGRSYHIERFISKTFRMRLSEILRDNVFDIIQMETLFMSPYLDTLRQYSEARIVLRAHNIEHLIWKRIAHETRNFFKRWYLNHLAGTLENYEHSVLEKFDGIAAITPTDAGYFRKILSDNRSPVPVVDIPFGVDPDHYPFSPEKAEFPSLFTIGSMNWIPNEEGIRWFLFNVWPDVARQFPSLKYYLAGREMPSWMRELKLPNVVVLGEVEDAREFMTSKAIMIVPLFSGSGIRIKIIEGLATGKTIISTSLGAEGIQCTNYENILIANIPCEFFEMISICVSDRDRCRLIGETGRELIKTQYNLKTIIGKLISFYRLLNG